MSPRRALLLLGLAALALASVNAVPPAWAAREGDEVSWGPLPPRWKIYKQEGSSTSPLPSAGSGSIGGGQILAVYDPSTGWTGRVQVRFAPGPIASLEQFAALLPPGPSRQFDLAYFNGQPAFHSRYANNLRRGEDWVLKGEVAGRQPWITSTHGCSFNLPAGAPCEAMGVEIQQVLGTLHFSAGPPPGLTARIVLPSDLKPGDEVSPSAVITDEDGRPPRGEVALVWTIGGQQRNSVTWDGKPLRIDLQASADGQPLTASTILPEFGTAPPPGSDGGQPPAGPVPGFSGIGGLPGPRNTTEGLVGTLGPAAVGLLGALLSGLLNAPPAPPPPVTPPKPKGPRKGRKKGKGSVEGEEGESPEDDQDEGEEEDEEKEESKKSIAKGKSEKLDKEKGPDKEKPPAKPVREKRPRPEPKPPDPGDHVRERLEQLRRMAESKGSRELLAAIDKAMAQGFGKDGKFDPEAWKAAQKDLWAVRDRAWKNLSGPNSLFRDALGVTFGAPAQGAMMGIRAAGSMIGGLMVGGYKGIKAIGDAALHLGTFLRGAGETISQWADKNAVTEKKGFTEGLRDGRVGDALIYLGMGTLKAGYQAGGKVVNFIKRDILPVDELSSLVDSNASLEEKLWAVPAAAAKIAGLLTMRETPTTQPSTRWGAELQRMVDRFTAPQKVAQAAGAAAERIGQIESRISQLERITAKPAGAGAKGVLEGARKALEKAQTFQRTIGAAQKVEQLGQQAMAGKPPLQNFQQAQRVLKDNPALTQAIDDALIKNNGGGSLYDLRAREVLGQDAHTLVTARKLQLQEQAINSATKRMIAQEAQALRAAGQPVPRRFDTFNATQGSRSRLSGSNCNADFDQTVLGLKNVTREQAEQIVREECQKLGMTQPQLDVNIYTPRKGLMDARGAAPNAQATLENIGQTTGTSGHHQVYVGRDGKVHVGDHVFTPQGREGVLAGRRSMDPPPGMTREQWLKEGVWEGHQGAPVKVPRAQWEAVRQTQISGLHHAFLRGDLNQMVKYANRGRTAGMPMGEATENLMRAVAGQKDPALAVQRLRDTGINSPEDLMRCLGVPH